MINQCTPSCSYMLNESLIQEEKLFCETPISTDLVDVLQLIEKNKSSLHNENSDAWYRKWQLKIHEELISINDHPVNSFANKLIKLNCGSVYEKRLFLSAIYSKIMKEQFEHIRNIIYSLVKKIQGVALYHADKKIESIITTGSNNYNDLKKIILENAEETLHEEFNVLELTESISNRIYEFHKKKYIENELKTYIELCVEYELRKYIDIEKAPFTTFIDLYRDHLEENHHYIMSKSIETFYNIVQDEGCRMSFVFDTFLGHMVYYKDVEKLIPIFCGSVISTKGMIVNFKKPIFNDNNTKDSYSYCEELKKVSLDSEKEMKEKMEKFLLENSITVVDKNVIVTCNKEFMKKIIDSSIIYLRSEIKSYLYSFIR